jgi:hypothetical protein
MGSTSGHRILVVQQYFGNQSCTVPMNNLSNVLYILHIILFIIIVLYCQVLYENDFIIYAEVFRSA